MMRVAVIGCGYWGSKHARVLQAMLGTDHVTLVDRDPTRLEALADKYPGVETRHSVDAALADVDAAIVAVPPSLHAPIAEQLMRAGKHVLVEKPLALTVDDSVSLAETADEMGVRLAVGHTFEHNSSVLALRNMIREGRLGDVYYLDTARLNLGLYQPDCDVMWDLAPHDISIANLLLDDVPDLVQANGSAHANPRHVDVAYLRLTYSRRQNVTVHIHVSWLDPCKVRRVTVVGSEMMAVYNDMLNEEPIKIFDKGVEVGPAEKDLSQRPTSYRIGDIWAPYVPASEPLVAQDADFLDAIRKDREPTSNAARGIGVVAVLEAAAQSLAEGGRAVRVTADRARIRARAS